MRLVRRHVEAELHRADDTAVELGGDQHGLVARDRSDDLLEERCRIVAAERQHEADLTRRCFDADRDQHVGKLMRSRPVAGRGIEND